MDSVLELDPPNALVFKGPFTDVTTSLLTIKNTSDRFVGFKVKTTKPKQYTVQPNTCILGPKETQVSVVRLQPERDGNLSDKQNHKFMVQYTFLPSKNVHFDDAWKHKQRHELKDFRLKAVFEGSSESDVYPMSTGISSAAALEQQFMTMSKNYIPASPGDEHEYDCIPFNDSTDSSYARAVDATSQFTENLTALEREVETLKMERGDQTEQLFSFTNSVGKLHEDIARVDESVSKLHEEFTEKLETEKKEKQVLAGQLAVNTKLLKDQQATNDVLVQTMEMLQLQLQGMQAMITCSRLWIVTEGQFTVAEEIGRGSWATVHKASFKGTTVAAKCLHEMITVPHTKQLFLREMEMALQCQHANIVTFLGAQIERRPVILMELMDISLRTAYSDNQLSKDHLNSIFLDIAKALHFIHTLPEPVIHRDVSSANVLLKGNKLDGWVAKLGDLGTAKLQSLSTTPGPGCISYAAPEVSNIKEHSTKMDVFSYGVVFVETLTQTFPFENLSELKEEVRRGFPRYYQLVADCTKKQKDDRPSMLVVMQKLQV